MTMRVFGFGAVVLLLSLALLAPSVSSAQQPEADYDWGWGFGLMGPAPFVDVQAHWFPAGWVAFDAGGMVLPAAGASGHVGARLRPVELGPVQPFVGASATGVVALGACEERDHETDCGGRASSMAGPRVGADFELGRSSMMLGVEADAFLPLQDEPVLYSDGTDVVWWGGAYFLWLY